MSDPRSDLFRPYSCMDNHSQEIARVLCYKATAALSVMGNIYTIAVVCKKSRQQKSSIDPYQRIMVGLSSYGMLFSLAWFMGSWMAPSESGWWGAMGGEETCTMQGYFIWFGAYGLILYSVLLSGQMLLLVTFGWTERKFEQMIERRAHVVIFLFSFLAATIPLFFDGYNGECGQCCMMPMPMWCGDWFWGDGTECVRGNPMLAQVYWAFFFAAFPLVTLFVTAAMFTVYRTVHNQEKRTNRFRFDVENHFQESKRIRKTMLLYTSSFYICYLIPLACLWAHPVPQPIPALNIIGQTLLPFQGVFVMCVVIQPRCVKYQKDHPGTGLLVAYVNVVFNVSGCRKMGGRFSLRTTYPDGGSADDEIGFSNYNEVTTSRAPARHSSITNIDILGEKDVEDIIEEKDEEDIIEEKDVEDIIEEKVEE